MLNRVDLNCDMGELMPGQRSNFDRKIMPFISSCNVACGFHSGSPPIIEATIQAAIEHGVHLGAHPSYNDRANFGRKSIDYNLPELVAELRYQISAVKGMIESMGGKLHHVKPHGALYNDMVIDERLATAVVQLIKSIDPSLRIFGLAHSQVIRICNEEGMTGVNEGFADRKYDSQKQLRSRSKEDAVIHDPEEVLQQIDHFINEKVILYTGEAVPIKVDSICLHSDTQGAVDLSRQIFDYLKSKNISIG